MHAPLDDLRALLRASWLLAAITAVACTGSASGGKEGKKSSERGATATGRTVGATAPVPPFTSTSAGTRASLATIAQTKTGTAPTPLTGPRLVALKIDSSLEAALVAAVGSDVGTPLSQVVNRVLIWWVDVRRELRRGDRIEIVYEPRTGEEPLAHAIWFRSGKLGRTVSAISYQAKGEPFARWYGEDGSEIELRLDGGPVDRYEQVTSLLNDGRRHKGVDFKTPVGTEVRSPFEGVVVRKNWGKRNGNCIELEDVHSGRHAKLLHLDAIEPGVKAGARVKKGQVIARSGNTGRSMAPHLHYQLEAAGKPINPFAIHKTWRAKLSAEEAEKAKAMLGKYAQLRTGE